MRNKPLIRFQLLLLALVAALVIWRGQTGPSIPDGTVVFSEMADGKLYRSGLLVDRDVAVVVSHTASFETDAENAPLATYGWILDNASREVVWMTDPTKMTRDGVLTVGADTIWLAPGSYDVFYTALGPSFRSRQNAPFLGLKPYWTNYQSSWQMSVAEVVDGVGPRALIADEKRTSDKRSFDNPLWATGPVRAREDHSFLFRVQRSTPVRIYAIGEMCPTGCDYGWIENARSNEKVWQMDWDNTIPAGGTESNREFDGSISLDSGIFRAVYRSNGGHSSGSWEANPPYDPDGWGMTLFGIDGGSAAEFDPWDDDEPIIQMTQVGDDEHRMTQFRVTRETGLFIYTLGEIASRGSLYDYSWLEENTSGNTVWTMTRENSLPAGGDAINRSELAFVNLEPGTYTLHFVSDGGHSVDGWVRTKPPHSERWGVTVFPIDRNEYSDSDIEILPARSTSNAIDDTVSDETPSNLGNPIVSLVQVGNDADLFYDFTLETESVLYVVAQGEISSGGSWDYGWIEANETNDRVWEMTLRNTTIAGGEDRNRRFANKITLPAGAYTARYVSDFSHSYGDFGDESPDNPEDWGLKIFVVRN